ncbi:hypothetical protein QFC19_004498 [Naganishia cerealis]|uniref:Uncharacterized protein n=1 Tax=Naganishia cerealis TaxID=610337 RepID=A0ACC2VVM6_9TREE|nr:hypothetical protein QFC19_004498 [Naganishia cerealis]
MDFRNPVTDEVIKCLSRDAQQCIRKLAAHQPDVAIDVGKSRAAAVFIGLFEKPGITGLQVLLTTRAKTLRSHPNQTAFPGGKVDPTDVSPEFTANWFVDLSQRREAFEEVGLPMGYHRDLHYVAQLQPFLSKYKIIVFPVVYLISSMHLIDSLTPSPDEVGAIWSLPLEYCLTAVWKEDYGVLSEKGGPDWPYEDDYYNNSDVTWLKTSEYRMNRFRTTQTPLKGLTCDITMSVAEIAFGRRTAVDRYAEGQVPFFDAVKMAVQEEKSVPEEIRNRPEMKITGNGDNPDELLSLPVTPSVEVPPYRPTAAL